MNTPNLFNQLHSIYAALKISDETKAADIFSSLNITDTPEHLSLPKDIRLLIWNLYEYLIVGDHENVTDKSEILRKLEILLTPDVS